MKKSIYFCGSIRGGRQDAELYAEVIKELTKYGEVLTEHVGQQQVDDVHVGAGHHSLAKTDEYKTLCVKACQEAVSEWQEGLDVVNVVVKAVSILEDSPITNAGTGSSLTEDKRVECDASVVEGTTQYFGAVGAVSEIQNPIVLAKRLLDHQRESKLTHGRVPPAFLVAEGAKKWACANGLMCVNERDMMTRSVVKLYDHYKTRLMPQPVVPKKRRLEDVCNYDVKSEANLLQLGADRFPDLVSESSNMEVTDTVGAVAVDANGRTAAAVSSGGLMMKQSGRVGPAAMIGSGCWAEDYSRDGRKSVAISTTGCGETLMRCTLAKECATTLCNAGDDFPTIALQNTFTDKVLNSKHFEKPPERLVGALLLLYDASAKHGEVFWAHTTDSMCLAFVSSKTRKAKSRMSRLHEGTSSGQVVVVEGSSFKF